MLGDDDDDGAALPFFFRPLSPMAQSPKAAVRPVAGCSANFLAVLGPSTSISEPLVALSLSLLLLEGEEELPDEDEEELSDEDEEELPDEDEEAGVAAGGAGAAGAAAGGAAFSKSSACCFLALNAAARAFLASAFSFLVLWSFTEPVCIRRLVIVLPMAVLCLKKKICGFVCVFCSETTLIAP